MFFYVLPGYVLTLLISQAKEDGSNHSSLSSLKPLLRRNQYDLVGVVVHSGQANAGHYYSYIKVVPYLS